MMRMIRNISAVAILSLAISVLGAHAQKTKETPHVYPPFVEDMLKRVHDAVEKNYYDPTFHGVDMDARYREYDGMLKSVRTVPEAFHIIAGYLSVLNDSHTYFIPPLISYSFDYGFVAQMIGDRCFITEVRPGSDAAKKIHPGDEILKLNNYSVNRADFVDLEYYLYALSPQKELNLELRNPDGATRTEQVLTKLLPSGRITSDQLVLNFETSSRLSRDRTAEVGNALVWKIPAFDLSRGEMDRIIGKADKEAALIIDLRENPGGLEDAVTYLTGFFFDHELKMATPVGRKHQDPVVVKPHDREFKGKLFVLVDSGSASASEIFARTIQLNHRGTVIGDLTEGAVMQARVFPLRTGFAVVTYYGVQVTTEDLIMPDGKSLEKVGVTPDVPIVPTGADLAAGRDPVLAQAVQLAGGKLDPVAAGKLFPFEWAPLQQ